ncbi:DUF3885 domain-containing protein [Metabacillus litoralis]
MNIQDKNPLYDDRGCDVIALEEDLLYENSNVVYRLTGCINLISDFI